jgi:hypothetical protein
MTRITPEINLLIIALVLAAKTKRSFTIKELAKVLPGSRSTLLGELIMISSLSLAKIRIAGTPVVDSPELHWSDKPLNVESVPSYLRDNAEKVYQEKLEAKSSGSQEGIDGDRDMLNEVCQLFPV